jgi:hypothetical protein
MISALALTLMLGADGEALPSSAAMYISILEPVATASPGAGITVTPVSVAVRVGGVLNGKHALLVGLSFATQFASSGNASGTTLTLMPTYRFFFEELHAGGFSPYVQAEMFIGYATANAGGPSTNSVPFGFGGSVGGEYLFSRHFGVNAGAGLRFTHSETSFGGASVSGNSVGIYVSLGAALHF